MRRILLPWILDVVSALDDLNTVKGGEKLETFWFTLFEGRNQIETLFNQSIYAHHLRISRQKAEVLHSHLVEMIGDGSQNDRMLNDIEVWLLRSNRDHFKTVFLSELSTLPVFLVSGKESYDVNLLVDDGFRLFPPTMASKAPEAIRDAQEAGKAIAFELSTAAGFHIFRIVESVLKRYWDHASKQPRPNLETIGSYALELEKGKYGDAKIWESLKQLAKLHRNPLIHPEVILDVGEEIEILGISRSVVGAMLKTMPDVPTTTTTATSSAAS